MLDLNHRHRSMTKILSYILLIVLSLSLISCSSTLESSQLLNSQETSQPIATGKLSEVAPPLAIEQLRQSLEPYQPQVEILSPRSEQVLQDTTVKVRLAVKDLPLFKDADLEMGPHLHLILDNEPYRAVYDVYDTNAPVVLDDLAPGTHTLRVFASRPWHESFKNEGAYAQTTFHILTKTNENRPVPTQPLLTYSRPQGIYGAEPIMLDFYLTNAPLHVVARKSSEDEIADWRIRVTVNGQSFVIDNWQPIYLTGFEKGKNWVQLEFLDEQGNPVENTFNNTVRLITYNPKGQDTLSKLVRGDLTAEAARGIVDANYKARLTPTPTPTIAPSPVPTPTVESTPTSPAETLPTEEFPEAIEIYPAPAETPSSSIEPEAISNPEETVESPFETSLESVSPSDEELPLDSEGVSPSNEDEERDSLSSI